MWTKDAAEVQACDKIPTRGVECSIKERKKSQRFCVLREDDCEEWAEYLAEEARVRVWKRNKGCSTEGSFVFDDIVILKKQSFATEDGT